jgi:hypothetical protein
MSRPRILDAERRIELCNLLASGLSLSEAARGVGCSLRTLRRETDRDDAFRQQISQVLLANRLNPLYHICQAALTDWRAATWLLERFCPEQFARRDRASCSPKDLQTVVDRVIETVLQEIDKQEDRTRVYRVASEVARRGFNELFPAPRRDEQRLMRGSMPLREWEDLMEHVERSTATFNDMLASPGDPSSAASALSATTAKLGPAADKTAPFTDRTPPVVDKASPRASGFRFARKPGKQA